MTTQLMCVAESFGNQSCIGLIFQLDHQKWRRSEFLSTAGHGLGGISLGRGSQGTSSLPVGSEEFLGIPKVPPSS